MNSKEEIPEILQQISEFVILAGHEQAEFIKIQASELQELTEQYLAGQISEKSFMRLLKSHKRLIQQNLNTLEIQSRSQAEKILFGILDVIKNKIIG